MGAELSLWDYLIPTLILVGSLIVGIVVRRYLFHYLHLWAQRSAWEFDNIIINATRGPFLLWVVALGIYLALEFSRLPNEIVVLLGKVLLALVVLSMTLVLANIVSAIFQRAVARGEVEAPATSLTRTFIRAGVIIVGILVLLSTLGISITPILTAFGIGGLAVALALQDTLTNLFAGFNVSMAKQIRVGDYIKLDTGQEGYVTDINWRTTSIRDFANNLIIIPNCQARPEHHHELFSAR
jgi:small-conductance mechanosensitive channel